MHVVNYSTAIGPVGCCSILLKEIMLPVYFSILISCMQNPIAIKKYSSVYFVYIKNMQEVWLHFHCPLKGEKMQ